SMHHGLPAPVTDSPRFGRCSAASHFEPKRPSASLIETDMSDIKLFQLKSGKATELQGDASDLEKPLQTLIEANLQPLLGIRFLATEYSTGKTHAGRIDSL